MIKSGNGRSTVPLSYTFNQETVKWAWVRYSRFSLSFPQISNEIFRLEIEASALMLVDVIFEVNLCH